VAEPQQEAQIRPRRGYLDWMRGLAVLIMIEAHVIDSWTRLSDRQANVYGWSMVLGGFGAPLFLFLAGLSVVLSASSKFRRGGDANAAARAVVRRGFEIFLLALLFRVQAWILGWGSPTTLLKVDILNIMGPAIMAAAVLWGLGSRGSARRRYALYAVAMIATTLLTPIVRATSLIDPVPDAIEGYFRPVRGITSFAFFPWAGFVFAGALLGLAIDQSRTRASEAWLNARFFIGGAMLALSAYGASSLPTVYARSDFWTSSPSFFFIRVGLMTAAVAVAYAWERRRATPRWSPMQQLGRTSLFIYWIHVEMVYGLVSLPLHKALPFGTAWLAFGAFSVFMLLCAIGKDRVVSWWSRRRRSVPATPLLRAR
jgi:uncharacterized membrane protein